jgi:formate/nitrite transporter FocA (FNT family)
MSSPSADSANEQTTYEEILVQQLEKGLTELERPTTGLVLSALSAGLDMGFGPLLMAAMYTLVSGLYGEPLTTILLATLYSVGFIFVILGRSELFTEHTTLAVVPVLDGRSSVGKLGRLWGLVFVGNVVGGAIFAAFAVFATPTTAVAPAAFEHLASTYTEQPVPVLFSGAILAGWLMGLLSWLIAAAQDTISRVFFVWLVTASIAFMHLPHCIAGTVEVLMGALVSPTISLVEYGQFLLLTTVGNAIGGVIFVALLKYGHTVRGNQNGMTTNGDE